MSRILSIVFPSIFIALGALGLIERIILRLKCTERVEAEVVDIVYQADSDGGRASYPVYAYYYEGVDYRQKSTYASFIRRFNIGDTVELLINPNRPEKFYCPKETLPMVAFLLLFSGSGVVLLWLFTKTI